MSGKPPSTPGGGRGPGRTAVASPKGGPPMPSSPAHFRGRTRSKSSISRGDSDGDRPKLKILKTQIDKPIIVKREAPPQIIIPTDQPPPKDEGPPPPAAEEKPGTRRYAVTNRGYRGNMNLIQPARKDAAKVAIKGQTPKAKKRGSGSTKSPSGKVNTSNKKVVIVTRKQKRKEESAWDHLMKRIFGSWVAEDVTLRTDRAKAAARALDLTQDHLKKMKMAFERIDIDGSGSIDVQELFEILNEKRSPYTDALFAVIDIGSNGILDFEDFLRVICTYSMYTEEDILRFTFDCFDKDGSGTVDEAEFITLCQIVNNANPLFLGNFARALEQFDVNEDGLIDFHEFVNIYRKYPMMLYPAFRLQDAMQHFTLGEKAWTKIHENIQRQRKILDYRKTHNGKDPPPRGLDMALFRLCCPCCFQPIKISPALLAEQAALN